MVLSKPISGGIVDLNLSLMGADHKCGTTWVICPALPFTQDIMHLDELALKETLRWSGEEIKGV